MSYDKVTQAENVVIGTKQTIKALEQGNAIEVIIANDADARVVTKVQLLAQKKGVPITAVDSMKKLGKVCGIDVGAATVTLTK
ncbi:MULTISPECIES: 50S ribosomal protein L7ae-like protein [Alkalihalobacterium]|uniref:RNA-binding protein N7Z68_20605 n=1 Tax=Alkalihalobacterium chitinilyticum TaxID=2980103 RepID=A0ABT5VMN1_9BACI|nr:50S ribosomal protein L7ae-like protein [Alkalihalobacterium chitinilyticum]MDE5415753.1 50S ribosomal protein L7ae-like protein [Alkalihalobacterium chitinilyticum]MEB1809826.1 50S ribosomal protein L7ae-like protein [Bacillaceae bacterium]